jgi:hypothetical protein
MGMRESMFACCKEGPPGRSQGSKSLFGSSQKLEGSGSHSIMRSGPLAEPLGGPPLWQFILIPWLCAVVIAVITAISAGASWFWVVIPALIVCGASVRLAWENYKKMMQPMVIFYVLCCLAGFSAFIVSLITFIHFLQPYHELGEGATYLNMLPSQSALGASDATAIVFAPDTSIDTSRTYGFVDARHSDGTMYCVAPVANPWTAAEPGVQFFAAGTNCCDKRSNFGCSQGGHGARGAMVIATEFTADPGYISAVEGAAVAYHLKPGNGWLLLKIMEDPVQVRADKLDSGVKLLLIYCFVYLIISCMIGFMAYKWR